MRRDMVALFYEAGLDQFYTCTKYMHKVECPLEDHARKSKLENGVKQSAK